VAENNSLYYLITGFTILYEQIFLFLTLILICNGTIFAQDSLKIFRDSIPLPIEDLFITSPMGPEMEGLTPESSIFMPKEYQLQITLNLDNAFPTTKTPTYVRFILPVTFISYGVVTHFKSPLRTIDLEAHKEVTEHFSGKLTFDDYLQFAPAVGVYGFELMGFKPKHNFRDRTFIIASSHLMMAATINVSKRLIDRERPDDGNRKSFPSGHTATAFTGAHILYREYKDTQPWIAVAGYTAATITGGMRVMNKRHWVSDVVAGAGVGMLSVELSYLLLPAFQRMWGGQQLVILPAISTENYGAAVAYTF